MMTLFLNVLKKLALLLVFLLALCIILFFGYIFVEQFDVIFYSDERNDWGAIGNYFGGTVGTVASLCGFIVLVITLNVNQKEFRKQAAVIQKQRFEDSFFALLEQHNRTLERILSDSGEKTPLGSDNSIQSLIAGLKRVGNRKSLGFHAGSLSSAKMTLLAHDPRLNQYFRILYQILKFIATECPDTTLGNFEISFFSKTKSSKSEKFYSNIVRACMPANFYYLLAINCYAENEKDQYYLYKLLIERYEFLEHMSIAASLNQSEILLHKICECP